LFFKKLTSRQKEINSLLCVGLDPDLKKKRARGNDLADVFSEMMKDDLRRVRPGWVE